MVSEQDKMSALISRSTRVEFSILALLEQMDLVQTGGEVLANLNS